MIDAAEIQRLQQLPIEEVADRLGLRVQRHKALCPFHADHSPSLTFNVVRNRYRCYVCGAHGNTIDLVREYQRFSFPEACEWLGAEHHLPARTTLQQPVKPSTIDRAWLSNLVQTPHLTAEARQFLFEERGIRQSVVRWLNVSSIAYDVPMGAKAGSGIFRAPAILLPYYDECGNLQSVQARYLGPAGKSYRFQFPKGGVCGIYNKPIATRLNDGDDLYLAEGVTDCMALLSSGRKSLAIPSATLLKASDTEWLKQLADSKHLHLHIYPDQDEPGERLFLRLRDTFPDIERHQLPIGCKDYGSYWKMIKDN